MRRISCVQPLLQATAGLLVNNRSAVVRPPLQGGVSACSHWILVLLEFLLKSWWEENFQQAAISKINPCQV